MRNLVIFGDSQFAERLSEYIIMEGIDLVCAFTQEARFMNRTQIDGIPVIPFEQLCASLEKNFQIILGIGYTKMNSLREQIFKLCIEAGYKVGTYISTKALVYSENIGVGCFISPGAVVGPGCCIGNGNYLESNVVFTHDNIIGDFNFFSTNVVLGGFAKVESNCFFGLHVTVKDDVSIASNNLIGAAANVLKTISTQGGVYVGNPARILPNKVSVTTRI